MTSSFAHVASVLRVTTRCTGSPFFTSTLLGSNPLLVTARSIVRAAGAAASRVAIKMAFMSLLLVRVVEGPGPSRRGTVRVDDKLQQDRGEGGATARMARSCCRSTVPTLQARDAALQDARGTSRPQRRGTLQGQMRITPALLRASPASILRHWRKSNPIPRRAATRVERQP